MNKQAFYSLGLTHAETQIYLSLLDLGTAHVGDIMEITGFHRRNIYDSLARLMKKGIVSFVIHNNKKLFSPANPRILIDRVEEKKYELENLKKEFISLMPELELKTKMYKRHDVRFFSGAEGLKTVFEDILRMKCDYIGVSPEPNLEKILRQYIIHYAAKRRKEKIKARMIYGEKSRKFVKKKSLTEVRYIPNEYTSDVALRVYADRIAILLLSKEDPTAVVIQNKTIADGYRKYFKVLWKAAKR